MKQRYETAVRQLHRSLRKVYGSNLKDVIVFGSVARDTDTAESDVDVMIVLDGSAKPVDWRIEKDIRGVAFDIELKYGVVFDVKVIDARSLNKEKGHTPFVERVFAEGVRP
ncbi:MAG: nucleotidyltransferase family protein [Verrucomicrobiota bacterium]